MLYRKISRLYIAITLSAHWIACVWHYIVQNELEGDRQDSWLIQNNLLDADEVTLYTRCLTTAILMFLRTPFEPPTSNAGNLFYVSSEKS